jgi:polysaccharide pyruvyl transferase WcaK-like protein
MKIFLHVAIPSARENCLLPLGRVQRLKMRVHHQLDWWMWSLLRVYRFESHNYSLRDNCNKGDIAIKVAIKELIKETLSGVPVEFAETEWGCLAERDLEEINRSAAIFVVAGGGYWVFNSHGKLSPSFPADMPFLLRMKCPVAVFGSGVNFNMPTGDSRLSMDLDGNQKSLFLDLDRRAALLGLRGETSLDFFHRLGIGKARLVPDPAVFLKPKAAQAPASSGAIQIGINLAFHGAFMEKHFRNTVETFIAVLKRLQILHKAEFSYFVHSDHELLIPRLFRAAGVPMRIIDAPAAEMTGHYRRMDALICQMMHSNILSFNAGLPALNVGYDSKNFEFNRMIGMEEYCLTAVGLKKADLLAKAVSLIENRKSLAGRLAATKAGLRKRLDAFLADFRDLAMSESREESVANP